MLLIPVDLRDTFSSKASVDLFDNFLNRLDDLGVRINSTVKKYLIRYIKRNDARRIEAALNLLKIRKRDGAIAEPAAYFIQLLKENYAGEKKIEVSSVSSNEDSQAKFNHWFELAREVGCCDGYEIIDEQIIVDMRGTKESWESAFDRGYNFEYFKKVMRQD